jgi:hypothetical protein
VNTNTHPSNRLRKDKRGVSPAISTAIITCAIVAMLLVALTFSSSYLNTYLAQNEFSLMQQFMQKIGLQIDDVAWIPGRTQTTAYTSKYGSVRVLPSALTYTFYADGSPIPGASFNVSILMFDMPITLYNLGNNYSQQIFPSTNSFLQQNASAPICRIFAVEKAPMTDGSFSRIIVAPIIREMDSTTNGAPHIQLYLANLVSGSSPQQSQSVTVTGQNLWYNSTSFTNSITISLNFPKTGLGFTPNFFNFDSINKTISVTSTSVAAIFAGQVAVSLGAFT